MPESLGKILKKIRETRHLSIQEASERTHIPKKIISAIEEDRLHEIASAFYARGFVKSYSKFLGALEEKTVKKYLAGTQKKDEPQLLLEGEKVPGDWFIKYKKHIGIALAGVFCIWLAAFGFLQTKKLAGFLFAKYKAHAASSRTKSRAKRLEQDSRAPVPKETQAKKAPKKKQALELEVIANFDTWMKVTGDGKLLFIGVFKKKERDIWRAKKEIKISFGNAGGVTLNLNEKDLGSPGKRGEKKAIVITKDGIKED